MSKIGKRFVVYILMGSIYYIFFFFFYFVLLFNEAVSIQTI
jgi:hypothetical protein